MLKKLLAIMLCALCLAGCGGGSGGGSGSGGGDPKKEVQSLHDKYLQIINKTATEYSKHNEDYADWSPELAEYGRQFKNRFEEIARNIECEKVSKGAESYKAALQNYNANFVALFDGAVKEIIYSIENRSEDEKQAVRQATNQVIDSMSQKEYEVYNEYSRVIKGKPALVMGIDGVNYLAFSSSKVDIAITKVHTENGAIGSNPYLQQEPMGKFFIVNDYMKNNQKDAITVDSNSFKLIDDEGREYSSSPEGQTALQIEQDSKAKGFLTRLNPNMGTSFSFVFDVPKELSTWDVQFEAKGGMTGKPTLMPLRSIKIEMVKD